MPDQILWQCSHIRTQDTHTHTCHLLTKSSSNDAQADCHPNGYTYALGQIQHILSAGVTIVLADIIGRERLLMLFWYTKAVVLCSACMLFLVRMVALSRFSLELGLVTLAHSSHVCTILVFNQPPRLTQPGNPPRVCRMHTSKSW